MRPKATLNKVAKVIMPKPPSCMSKIITICPNKEKYLPVSTTANPVTQAADVAVKSASTQGMEVPLTVARGSIKSNVPQRINPKKVEAII